MKHSTQVLLALLLHAAAVDAAPLLSATADLTEVDEGRVGFSVQLTNDVSYLVISQAALETTLDLTLTDFLTLPENFVVIGPGPFAQPQLQQQYAFANRRGFGFLTFGPSVTLPASLHGTLQVFYDLFSVSPDDPGFNPDTDTLSNGNQLSYSFDINVDAPAPVPEPAGGMLAGLGLIGLFARRRRKQAPARVYRCPGALPD